MESSGVFHGLQAHSPFLCKVLVILFFGKTILDLAKSCTSVVAVVLETSDTSLTSFLSRVFEIFPFLPLPGSYSMAFFEFLGTLHFSS